MHPAKSVIFFTTASGAGYGLVFWLAAFAATGALPASSWCALIAFALALGLITAGLLASTIHLGHPERAWRALSQWRSSWLSREGVAAIASYVPIGLFAATATVYGFDHWSNVPTGLLAAAGAVATVTCTAMIYASLRAVPAWATPLTLVGYLLYGGLTGVAILHALLWFWGVPAADGAGVLVIALVFIAFAVKMTHWHLIDTEAPASTAGTATGLEPLGRVRLLEAPHTSPNYLMKEMGFAIARRHARMLRRITVIAAFFVPAGLTMIALAVGGTVAFVVALIAALSCLVGVAVERWLFFAEARHVVSLYYGASLAPGERP